MSQSIWSIHGINFFIMLGALCLKIQSDSTFLEWKEKGTNISVPAVYVSDMHWLI